MADEKQNMDHFLRESLGNLETNPSKNVWKGVSKKLILLELIRLNFSNIGKSWLYTGAAAVTAFAGFTLYQLNQETSPTETPNHTEVHIASDTKVDKGEQKETYQITETDLESAKDDEIIRELEPIEEISKNQEVSKASALNRKVNVPEPDPKANPVIKTSREDNMVKDNENIKINHQEYSTSKIPSAESMIVIPEVEAISQTPHTRQTPQPEPLKTSETSSLKDEEKPSVEEKTHMEGSSKKEKTIAPLIISEDDKKQEVENSSSSKLSWFIGAHYTPEWPISSEDMYVNNNQLGLRAGVEYKKWAFSIGIGVKSEKTPSRFMAHYSTFDSVGFYYDIDYYEQVPNFQDSIIIHYDIRSIFDSIDHESVVQGPDQKRRWIFIPIDFSYRLYQKPKYELMAKVSANFGWSNYTEEIDLSTALAGYYQLENITVNNNDTYLQVGIGLENNFSILPNWWIYAEPRLNYYVKSPYEIKGNSSKGPFAFGLQIGIKYKFNR